MKLKDLRAKSPKELRELLETTGKKIAQTRFDYRNARSKNVKELRELRKERARILTLLGNATPPKQKTI